MPDLTALPRSDCHRVVLLAVGPGLVAGTLSSLLLGYGVEAPNVLFRAIFTYAYLLLWSIPALPLMALALVRWIPRRHPIRLRGPLLLFVFLVASVWHLIVLEVISWVDTSGSFLFRNWERIAAAHLPAACCTVASWLVYLFTRQHGSRSLP